MIKLFFIFSIAAKLLAGTQNSVPRHCLQIEISSLKEYQGLECKGGQFYHVKVKMINITSDTLEYWMMSCSRSDFFTTNQDAVSFCGEICRSNGPELVKLNPFKQDSFFLDLSVKGSPRIPLKIGFVMLSKYEYEYSNSWKALNNLIKKKIRDSQVIWSNEIPW